MCHFFSIQFRLQIQLVLSDVVLNDRITLVLSCATNTSKAVRVSGVPGLKKEHVRKMKRKKLRLREQWHIKAPAQLVENIP